VRICIRRRVSGSASVNRLQRRGVGSWSCLTDARRRLLGRVPGDGGLDGVCSSCCSAASPAALLGRDESDLRCPLFVRRSTGGRTAVCTKSAVVPSTVAGDEISMACGELLGGAVRIVNGSNGPIGGGRVKGSSNTRGRRGLSSDEIDMLDPNERSRSSRAGSGGGERVSRPHDALGGLVIHAVIYWAGRLGGGSAARTKCWEGRADDSRVGS